MADELGALQNLHGSITRDVFIPNTTRRRRAWERAPVKANAPRLRGQKIWKRIASNPIIKENGSERESEVQGELSKEGAGSRKKIRMIGAKEDISDAPWIQEGQSTDDVEGAKLDAHTTNSAVQPAINATMNENNMKSTTTSNDDAETTVHWIPRKRTNTNHIITPMKPVRRSARLSLKEPVSPTLTRSTPTPRRRRRSIRPSQDITGLSMSRFHAGQSPQRQQDIPEKQTESDTPRSEASPQAHGIFAISLSPIKQTSPTKRNIRRSRGSRASLGLTDEAVAAMLPPPKLEEPTPVEMPTFDISCPVESLTKVHMVDISPSSAADELNKEDFSLQLDKAEANHVLNLDDASLLQASIAAEQDSDSDALDEDYTNDAESDETDTDSSEDEDRNAEFDLDVTQTTELLNIVYAIESPTLEEDIKLSPMRSSVKTDVDPDTPSKMGYYIPFLDGPDNTEVEELDSVGCIHTNLSPKRLSPSKPQTDTLTETKLLDSQPSTFDFDDTDMLRNFLSHVNANKALRLEQQRTAQSPERVPLGEVTNLSPSPQRPSKGLEADFEAGAGSPTRKPKRNQPNEIDAPRQTGETTGRRRSSRTKVSTRESAAPAPSFIPLRRIGDNDTTQTTITLKRTQEKELAALTRVNTRKNKSGALSALEMLAKLAEERENPALRQKMLKEAFEDRERAEKNKNLDEVNEAGKRGKKSRKSVIWAEQLEHFQEWEPRGTGTSNNNANSIASVTPITITSNSKAKTISGIEDTERPAPAPESVLPPSAIPTPTTIIPQSGSTAPDEKRRTSVRVGMRSSKIALGMAANGTPARKRPARNTKSRR